MVPVFFVHEHAADHGAVLVCDEISGSEDMACKGFILGVGHELSHWIVGTGTDIRVGAGGEFARVNILWGAWKIQNSRSGSR